MHVPEGDTKDGPSAGITMLDSHYISLQNKPVKPYFATDWSYMW
ncbi:MAG: hypothetical protein IPN86_04800 [Saprospiraceae bacterium]|nr:hypothetical protein [Saprospiraceae bacterium]